METIKLISEIALNVFAMVVVSSLILVAYTIVKEYVKGTFTFSEMAKSCSKVVNN